jgi:hypothetical protein
MFITLIYTFILLICIRIKMQNNTWLNDISPKELDLMIKNKTISTQYLTQNIMELTRNNFDKNPELRYKAIPKYELLVVTQLNNIKWNTSTLNIMIDEAANTLFDDILDVKTVLNDENIKWINNIGITLVDEASTHYICMGSLWLAFRYAYENGCEFSPNRILRIKEVRTYLQLKSYIDSQNIQIIKYANDILKDNYNYDKNLIYIIGKYVSNTEEYLYELKKI